MKLTAIMLFVACMQVSATAFSQKINLSDKKTPLAKVLGQIAQQSGYSLFYDKELISRSTQVDVQVSNASVEQALDAALKNLPLTWAIVDQTIVIKQKQVSATEELKDKLKAELAQVTVTGKVVDELGNPMIGVTVKQKDKPTNATATDSKGRYSLTVPDDKTTLVFTYVGYETQELAAKDIPTGSAITLKASAQNLHEVVVSKGYYNEKLELSTGNVSVITGATIQEQPVSDPIMALEGRVAGLLITQTSGIPGANETVRIRGQNSIANGNNPLYIVDGVQYNSTTLISSGIGGGALGTPGNGPQYGVSPFNNLNPADIESIEVLKDADATAIYGSRGANGVILITTKKGQAGKTTFNFNSFTGVGQVTHMMPMMNTQQYLQMRHEALINAGALPGAFDYDINGTWDSTRYTNWEKVFIGGTARFNNVEGTLSGGNANTQFLVAGGYSNQGTVYPGNYSDQKTSVRFNITNTSDNKKFNMLFSAGYLVDNDNLPQVDFTSNISLAPDAPALYKSDGSLNWANNTWLDPVAASLNSANATTYNLISNLVAGYEVLSGLHIKSSFSYNDQLMNQTLLTPGTSTIPINLTPLSRGISIANTDNRTWIIEPQVDYSRKIGKGTLQALLGSTIQQSILNSSASQYSGFSSDALITDYSLATNISIRPSSNSQYKYDAVYARVGYSWEDKYLINLTARRDGSSRFGPGNQFGNFGAIGAGWIFSKEKFIENAMPFLSFGKLRASYGTTGNDQLTPYQYLSTYTAGSSTNTYQGQPYLTPTGLPNNNFAWEVDKKLEGDLDLGFLNDHILFTATYYRNRTGNQLVGYPLPTITGFTTVQANLPAVLQNSGEEFLLNTINIKTADFRWSSSFNISFPENKLVSYPGLAGSPYASRYAIGQSLYVQHLPHNLGVNPQTGLYVFQDVNGDGQFSLQDYLFGNAVTQQYFGGFQNTFSYKGFSLDILLQFVKQTGFNYLNLYNNIGKANQNLPAYFLTNWQKPGDITDIQKFSTTQGFSTGDAAIGDASFIRLKNVALSYNLPRTWQQKMGLNSARIYLQAQNLFTITSYNGLDPETQGLNLPPLRMLVIGLQLGF